MKRKLLTLLIGTVLLPGMALAATTTATTNAYPMHGRMGQVMICRVLPPHHHHFRMLKHRNLNLNADQVKTLVSARIIMRGNPNIMVGKVTPAASNGQKYFKVDIVTKDNSLVREINISSKTGRPERI